MTEIIRPLQISEKQTLKNTKVAKTGSFQKMLDGHMAKIRTTSENKSNQTKSLDFSNVELLEEMDSEYYAKGVKKKTLAGTFSARNKSNLDTRIKKYQHLIDSKAKKHGLDPNLLAALVKQESNFNPYAVSHCGAMGLGQIMPETARYLGIKDPFNASQNIEGAAKYLKEQLNTFGGSVDKALAAYNAGPGAVKKYGGIPPYRETQNYVRAIKSHFKQISGKGYFV
jgi:soluble lytic murein transglycosylase-like protein